MVRMHQSNCTGPPYAELCDAYQKTQEGKPPVGAECRRLCAPIRSHSATAGSRHARLRYPCESYRYPPSVDPTVWAAIVGGLITGVPSVAAVVWSTKRARDTTDQAREQAAEEAHLTRSGSLALELARIREDLRSPVHSIAWDALDDLKALMVRVSSPVYIEDDRSDVWRLLQSRTAAQAAAIERYPQQEVPEVRVRPQLEESP